MTVIKLPRQSSRILVIDPVPFAGGTKNSCSDILWCLRDKGFECRVISAAPDQWRARGLPCSKLYLPAGLATCRYGIGFYAKHLFMAVQVLVRAIARRPAVLIAPSGPVIDFVSHIVGAILGIKVIQLVKGPIGPSRLAGVMLARSHSVFYLRHCQADVEDALAGAGRDQGRAFPLDNGISALRWPSPAKAPDSKRILWAASLLRWKRPDIMVNAMAQLGAVAGAEAHMCFIRPEKTGVDALEPDYSVPNIFWHESPDNLDTIRQGCSLFVSTAESEPFGLSILEAMAAGLCVLIPQDGAFWDTELVHGRNCIKYRPGCTADLSCKLQQLLDHPHDIQRIANAGRRKADQYKAEKAFSDLVATVCSLAAGDTGQAPATSVKSVSEGHV